VGIPATVFSLHEKLQVCSLQLAEGTRDFEMRCHSSAFPVWSLGQRGAWMIFGSCKEPNASLGPDEAEGKGWHQS